MSSILSDSQSNINSHLNLMESGMAFCVQKKSFLPHAHVFVAMVMNMCIAGLGPRLDCGLPLDINAAPLGSSL